MGPGAFNWLRRNDPLATGPGVTVFDLADLI